MSHTSLAGPAQGHGRVFAPARAGWLALGLWIAVGFFSLSAVAGANDNYLLVKLANGVSVELPRNWEAISRNSRVTLEAFVQDLGERMRSPIESELGLAANLYDDSGKVQALFNIRYYPQMSLTQADVRSASAADLRELDGELRGALEKTAAVAGLKVVSWLGTTRQTINGLTVLITEYRRQIRDEPIGHVYLARVLAGARSFTITVSYRERQEVLLQPICARIIRSIRM